MAQFMLDFYSCIHEVILKTSQSIGQIKTVSNYTIFLCRMKEVLTLICQIFHQIRVSSIFIIGQKNHSSMKVRGHSITYTSKINILPEKKKFFMNAHQNSSPLNCNPKILAVIYIGSMHTLPQKQVFVD